LKYYDLNDETLVMLTLAGEVCAYEVLVVRYEKAVTAAAFRVTGSKYMAQDAAQDAFITAWMKLDMLHEPSKYRSWVCRIAANLAKNTVRRYADYIDLSEVENYISDDGRENDPMYLFEAKEERRMLHEEISELPEKVRTVIRLHYFEGLSIVEIADRLRISQGTVKAQLHDGRKRLRKELCAMNENINDTLVQKVMKKVEELKLWQYKSSKNGFEAVYGDVLAEVEQLPESSDKYHALADVLVRGWWWLPGDKNDALFGRIRDAAINGKNDDVMGFVVKRESMKLHGKERISFIRDKQIPLLETHGFTKTLGYQWFTLGESYLYEKEFENGYEAFAKATEILTPSDRYYALAKEALGSGKVYEEKYKDKNTDHFIIASAVSDLRRADGELRYYDGYFCGWGYIRTLNWQNAKIFENASKCDGYFYREGMSVSDVYEGSDGSKLIFAEDGVRIDTACGSFEDCHKWVTEKKDFTYVTYYKRGVGIVKQECIDTYQTDVHILKAYYVNGDGYLPLCEGNFWEYDSSYNEKFVYHTLSCRVAYSEENRTLVTSTFEFDRLGYDESSWVEMMGQIREDYFDSEKHKVCDISYPMQKVAELAETPLQKAHTKVALSVAKRIIETNKEYTPDCTATGHWNFFGYHDLPKNDDGSLSLGSIYRWNFELKYFSGGSSYPLLYNHVYGLLEDVTERIWDDRWQIGYEDTYEFLMWGVHNVKTTVKCEAVGSITTAAGTFEGCMKLSLDTVGCSDGVEYFNGKKEYYFAEGVGIVRTVNRYYSNTMEAVYELTAYEGRAEGYFPVADGLFRRYEALELCDGYEASSEYTYVSDGKGGTVILSDRAGIKNKIPNITEYSTIHGEVVEEELWNAKKRDEARLRHDVNNFRIMCHFLGRDSRYWAMPKKAAEWNKHRMKVIEGFSADCEVPEAWLGFYIATCFRTACAIFGCKDEALKEEGYEYLERTFELLPKWMAIPDGTLLSTGEEYIFGGVRIPKGGEVIELPDGRREPLADMWMFWQGKDTVYYGLTAKKGWEWFDPVRNEERYKDYILRIKQLMSK